MLKEKIENLKKQFLAEIEKMKLSEERLFELEKKYTGRKSEFIAILKSLKDLSPEERKRIGELANDTKNKIWEIIKNKRREISENSFNSEKEKIDVTIPGKKKSVGHLNPISLVIRDIEDIFTSMGYEIADGPEIETGWYNFDALNIPKDHPARDMQDTFWLRPQTNADGTRKDAENFSMRSQTSAVQARYMEKHQPPFRIIVPGKVFRKEATDTTHDHTFYQFEALIVGENVNVGNLKFTAKEFFSAFFKQDVNVRLRPSYFPFTEPSFEFDISCTVCGGSGCRACKGGGWLELGGAGMVNQNVFVSAGYPRNKYQGFAWGFGLERLAMMKYKIDDVRLFHSGDLRFVKQF
ncbi:MAG: phenylalanine--tRNA ligase subunit alpha [Candidatus Moranbacteria bacterium CG23_combo_of_CG06-09_8_20_14_all_39_10]|nr:MAG: phenylalanine--tRNA ligase subunit alpha [Candidatus Moranbacteria bacterium CG23_combo_of_CG06-09_8_20_14_all_39_10]